ncbi:MAG: GntR family transcriptional regulator [Lautropia sp.]
MAIPLTRPTGPIPRYLQIADLIRQRIGRGHWRNGQRLPSLEAMVAEFGVARVTVRQAVDVLAREGLVSPQQGRGTFVTGQPTRDRWLKVQTTLAALARVYRDTRPTIVNLEESVTDAPLTDDDGSAAERYVFMRRVHSREGAPYCVINIYLAEDVFARHPDRFRQETVIPILAADRRIAIAEAHQVLTIGAADLEVAQYLLVPVNAPVAEVRRVFNDRRGRVIYLGEVTYRGDAVRLEMDLQP